MLHGNKLEKVRRKLPELRGRPHQLGALWVANHTCSNAEETCEMVKSNWLCECKLFIQLCCRPLGGGPWNSARRPHTCGDGTQCAPQGLPGNPHIYRILQPKWNVKHVALPDPSHWASSISKVNLSLLRDGQSPRVMKGPAAGVLRADCKPDSPAGPPAAKPVWACGSAACSGSPRGGSCEQRAPIFPWKCTDRLLGPGVTFALNFLLSLDVSIQSGSTLGPHKADLSLGAGPPTQRGGSNP
ncbi:PREDICTED: uncharacterized protein LOC102248839 isoform X2 [Myotis brandtii]|uniref:uncharacterized protein LOC102248839 isoform X2 n=1 Tax=Myotis brandtii TaxID=109478 RepID=UPI0007040120|nr:PREDICTED: uncharacterized protein LOC102248839 isoform X2 [Myotis brandtii]